VYPASGGYIDQGNTNQPFTLSAQGMWSGVSLAGNQWTTLNPDPQTADNNVIVTQGNGIVTFGLAPSITVTSNISAGNITVTGNITSTSRYTTGTAYSGNVVTGNITASSNVTAGAFVDTVTTVSVVSNAYTLDFSTCPNMLILNNGTTAFTITMVNYTPGKRVILSTPGIGGTKITVSGLTTTNSFNNTNQYAGLNGGTGAAVVELICTTNAASGVYLSDIVAK
jgi:hypothetical protein